MDFDESKRVKCGGAGGAGWKTEGEGTVLMYSNCQEGVALAVPAAWQYKPGPPKSYFSYGMGAQKYGWTMRSTREHIYIIDREGKDLFQLPQGETAVDENGECVPAMHVFPESVFSPHAKRMECMRLRRGCSALRGR